MVKESVLSGSGWVKVGYRKEMLVLVYINVFGRRDVFVREVRNRRDRD
jgi:hypothetical protein